MIEYKFNENFLIAVRLMLDFEFENKDMDNKKLWFVAQMCNESQYGNSGLAAENNFSGLKFRKSVHKKGETGQFKYTDHASERDTYFKCLKPHFFPALFVRFINRKRYQHISPKLSGYDFIYALDEAGFCATDSSETYASKCERIMSNGKFKALINQAQCFDVPELDTQSEEAPKWLNTDFEGDL